MSEVDSFALPSNGYANRNRLEASAGYAKPVPAAAASNGYANRNSRHFFGNIHV
jgi:hypothetical protein